MVPPPPPILSCLRADLSRLKKVLEAHASKGRTALSRQVCAEFDFRSVKGKWRTSSCLQALVALDQQQQIHLPAAESRKDRPNVRLLPAPVPPPKEVPDQIDAIEGLRIDRVEDPDARALWNTLMQEHPMGVTKFAGHQKKYLFRSAHGDLGGIGFSAPALYLAARDAWMGWSASQREAYRPHVIALSRFLIRSGVRCPNLASYLLARSLRQMRIDMKDTYGVQIWVVETFSDSEHEDPQKRYAGTCFRAAGFQEVGKTAGRGRHAPTHQCTRTRKSVWLYEFSSTWRTQLGIAPVDPYPILDVGSGLDGKQWVEQEFGDAALGDVRRNACLIKSVELLSAALGEPIHANLKMDTAAIRAYYRLLAPERVLPKHLLSTHRERTIERIRGYERVLFLIDETKINYSTLSTCDGLETIGRNQTGADAKGVRLHVVLPVTEQGLPLGVLHCGFDPSDPTHEHPDRVRWEDAVDAGITGAKALRRSTRPVVVIDREGDRAALIKRCLDGGLEVVVRAKHDRVLSKKTKLFGLLRGLKAAGTIEISVQRLSRRVKSGRVLHEGRDPRLAEMSVRYASIDLSCGRMNAVQIREEGRTSDALEWTLLTSLPVERLEDAVRIVEHYLQRWRVEDFFRVLKGGCKVGNFRMRSARRLHSAIAIHCVIAWRLMVLTRLGRDVPNAPVDLMFTEIQLRVLNNLAAEHDLPPAEDMASAVELVARMGGYQPSNKRPPPGVEVMWRGYQRLEIGATYVEQELKHRGRSPSESS